MGTIETAVNSKLHWYGKQCSIQIIKRLIFSFLLFTCFFISRVIVDARSLQKEPPSTLYQTIMKLTLLKLLFTNLLTPFPMVLSNILF